MNMLLSPRARQAGLTLVEIMVAIAISAILLAGVIQILIGSQESYRALEASARVQESGRFTIGYLNEDLRMAGYSGCYSGSVNTVDNILNDPDAFDWDLSNPITGHEWNGAGWTPALPTAIAGQVREGTDVVITRGMASDGIQLVPPYSDSAQMFVSPEGNNVAIGEVVMVTDCTNASIGQITNVQSVAGNTRVNLVHSAAGSFDPGNSTPQFSHTFGADAEVARLQSNVYYIGTNANGEPALFRRNFIGANPIPQELASGVENLQALYGEDTSGDGFANRYVTADAIDPDIVVSARVSLLMRTDDNIALSPQTYVYNGETIEADDRRLRRVFTSTVKLRNRGAL